MVDCHQELHWTTYSLFFFSTTFCHFPGNCTIPSFQNFFIFLSKELFQVPFTLFQGIEFFPLREFCKDWNKWKSKSTMSGEYGGSVRTSQPICNSFLPGHQSNMVLCYPDGRLCIFCWLILNAFHRELLSVGLMGAVFVGINHLVFLKELIIEDSIAIPPYTQHHLLWMRTGFWLWLVLVHFTCPQSILFHSIVQYPFSSPVTICFKNGMFLLRLSGELRAEIWSRRVFFA